MTGVDPSLPENWLLHGEALDTRRRRAGADAQRGFDYQRAFAVWKVAELLDDPPEIVGVRYEGAQDVDLLLADRRVQFVQLKDEPEETYPATRIAPILHGFILDYLDSGEDSRAWFELVVYAQPGAPALQRLASRSSTPADRTTYRAELLKDPRLDRLGVARLDALLDTVLARVNVMRGMGPLGGPHGVPAPRLLAEQALRKAQVAEEHINPLLDRIETSLKGRKVTLAADVRDWARAARRHPDRIFMAPALPAHFQARPRLIEHLRERLLTDHRAAIVGLGGAGKTMLAQALAIDPAMAAAYPDGVLWMTLGQAPSMTAHLQSLLRTLGRATTPEGDVGALHAELNAALVGRQLLLIIDDLWDMTIGAGFTLPTGCGLIVTARQPRVAIGLAMKAIEVDGLDLGESLALIERMAGPLAEADRTAAQSFIARVAGLAFAVRLGSLLVTEGRSFEQLVKDLDAEGLRLAALDIDRQDQPPSDQARRRDKSLEACLGLSVAALGPLLRIAFFRLAVLPDGAMVEPELASAMFALDDPMTARERLFDLAARGLISGVGPAYAETFRVHDLVLDYARGGFGPHRELLLVPTELPSTLGSLHGELVDRSLATSPQGLWAQCQPDLHFDSHLAQHLVAAGRTDDLACVLRETIDGRAAWLGRQRRHQNTAGFLQFVRTCLVERVRTLLIQPQIRWLTALADMMTAAAAGASATGRAAKIPTGLLSAMVRAGDLRFEDALAQANLTAYAQRAGHLVDLLPVAPTGARRTMLASMTAELVKLPLPLMADRSLVDRLLPLLSNEDVASLRAVARHAPEAESELLWGMARTSPSAVQVDEIVSYCRASNSQDLRDTLVLLYADGIGTIEPTAALITSAFASKRRHVNLAGLLLLPPTVLAQRIDTPNIAVLVIELWSRHAAHPSDEVIAAIWALIDRLSSSEALLGAWMGARLMAVTGHAAPDRLAHCEALLAAADAKHWYTLDGRGWLMQAASADARPRIVEALAPCAAAQGFHHLGMTRMWDIAAALPTTGYARMIDAALQAPPSGRAMILSALLKHAPEPLWVFLAHAVVAEARRSGEVGDLLEAGARIPGNLLRRLWQTVDYVRPTPELVHAAAALTSRLPTALTAWFTESWTDLRAHERFRAAAGHPDIAALYKDPQSILEDLAHAAGLASQEGGWLPLNALDRADAVKLLAGIGTADLRSFVDAHPALVTASADHHINHLLDWFGGGLSDPEIASLWNRVRQRHPGDRADALGRIAELLGDPSALDEAIATLIELGSKASAAMWLARYGSLTGSEQRTRLELLRDQDMLTGEAVMLEVALHPYLDQVAQAGVEQQFAQRRGLFPAFVAQLDRSTYPASMTSVFDLCLREVAPGDPADWLYDSNRLLKLPMECLPVLHADIASYRKSAFYGFAMVLATTVGMDVGKLCQTIVRSAPLLRSTLSDAERDRLAECLISAARSHAR